MEDDVFTFLRAVEMNDSELAEKLLKHNPEMINSGNVFCMFNFVNSSKVMSLILRHSGQKIIDIFKAEKKCIISCAIELEKSKEIIKEIILFDKDIVNYLSWYGDTPLMFVVSVKKDVEMIKFLLNYADINKINKNGQSLLHRASKLEIVRLLLENGAGIELTDKRGNTPLMLAIKIPGRDDRIIYELLKNGANVNACNNDRKTPLILAIEMRRDKKVLFELIKHGADLNAWSIYKHTPLHLVLSKHYEEDIVWEIFNKTDNVNKEDITGLTPLCFAFREMSIGGLKPYQRTYTKDFIFQLVNRGAVVNSTVFMSAVQNCKNLDIIKEFIGFGIDLRCTDSVGKCILHYANNVSLINIFVCKGVPINHRSNYGLTPLMTALLRNEDIKIIETLLIWGADPNCLDFYSHKKFLIRDDVLDLLVLFGANVSIVNNKINNILTEIFLKMYENSSSIILVKRHNYCILRHIFVSNENVSVPNYLLGNVHVSDFLQTYYNELNKMKEINIIDNISFYDFCIKYYKSRRKYINVTKSKFVKNDYKKVKKLFPIFYDAIIVKIKINIKKHKRLKVLNRLYGVSIKSSAQENNDTHCSIVTKPSGNDILFSDSVELLSDCLYHVGSFLCDGELNCLLMASILE